MPLGARPKTATNTPTSSRGPGVTPPPTRSSSTSLTKRGTRSIRSTPPATPVPQNSSHGPGLANKRSRYFPGSVAQSRQSLKSVELHVDDTGVFPPPPQLVRPPLPPRRHHPSCPGACGGKCLDQHPPKVASLLQPSSANGMQLTQRRSTQLSRELLRRRDALEEAVRRATEAMEVAERAEVRAFERREAQHAQARVSGDRALGLAASMSGRLNVEEAEDEGGEEEDEEDAEEERDVMRNSEETTETTMSSPSEKTPAEADGIGTTGDGLSWLSDGDWSEETEVTPEAAGDAGVGASVTALNMQSPVIHGHPGKLERFQVRVEHSPLAVEVYMATTVPTESPKGVAVEVAQRQRARARTRSPSTGGGEARHPSNTPSTIGTAPITSSCSVSNVRNPRRDLSGLASTMPGGEDRGAPTARKRVPRSLSRPTLNASMSSTQAPTHVSNHSASGRPRSAKACAASGTPTTAAANHHSTPSNTTTPASASSTSRSPTRRAQGSSMTSASNDSSQQRRTSSRQDGHEASSNRTAAYRTSTSVKTSTQGKSDSTHQTSRAASPTSKTSEITPHATPSAMSRSPKSTSLLPKKSPSSSSKADTISSYSKGPILAKTSILRKSDSSASKNESRKDLLSLKRDKSPRPRASSPSPLGSPSKVSTERTTLNYSPPRTLSPKRCVSPTAPKRMKEPAPSRTKTMCPVSAACLSYISKSERKYEERESPWHVMEYRVVPRDDPRRIKISRDEDSERIDSEARPASAMESKPRPHICDQSEESTDELDDETLERLQRTWSLPEVRRRRRRGLDDGWDRLTKWMEMTLGSADSRGEMFIPCHCLPSSQSWMSRITSSRMSQSPGCCSVCHCAACSDRPSKTDNLPSNQDSGFVHLLERKDECRSLNYPEYEEENVNTNRIYQPEDKKAKQERIQQRQASRTNIRNTGNVDSLPRKMSFNWSSVFPPDRSRIQPQRKHWQKGSSTGEGSTASLPTWAQHYLQRSVEYSGEAQEASPPHLVGEAPAETESEPEAGLSTSVTQTLLIPPEAEIQLTAQQLHIAQPTFQIHPQMHAHPMQAHETTFYWGFPQAQSCGPELFVPRGQIWATPSRTELVPEPLIMTSSSRYPREHRPIPEESLETEAEAEAEAAAAATFFQEAVAAAVAAATAAATNQTLISPHDMALRVQHQGILPMWEPQNESSQVSLRKQWQKPQQTSIPWQRTMTSIIVPPSVPTPWGIPASAFPPDMLHPGAAAAAAAAAANAGSWTTRPPWTTPPPQGSNSRSGSPTRASHASSRASWSHQLTPPTPPGASPPPSWARQQRTTTANGNAAAANPSTQAAGEEIRSSRNGPTSKNDDWSSKQGPGRSSQVVGDAPEPMPTTEVPLWARGVQPPTSHQKTSKNTRPSTQPQHSQHPTQNVRQVKAETDGSTRSKTPSRRRGPTPGATSTAPSGGAAHAPTTGGNNSARTGGNIGVKASVNTGGNIVGKSNGNKGENTGGNSTGATPRSPNPTGGLQSCCTVCGKACGGFVGTTNEKGGGGAGGGGGGAAGGAGGGGGAGGRSGGQTETRGRQGQDHRTGARGRTRGNNNNNNNDGNAVFPELGFSPSRRNTSSR